jgi:oligoribonuclease NrnB/cAMP/cGMP phosphodiesterase (DHH superfamily)
MKNLIIYHRVDFDGVFSALTVKWFMSKSQSSEKIDLFGYTYGDSLPDLEAFVKNYDFIWMVDISFDPESMIFLKKSLDSGRLNGLYWIDHHITAIQNSEKYNYVNMPGVRDKSRAATENAWLFLKNYVGSDPMNIPKVIQLISSYDIWDHTRFDWQKETLPLQSALKTRYNVSVDEIWPIFDKLLTDSDFLDELLVLGRDIDTYNKKRWASAVKSCAFEITVDDHIKGICCLMTDFTSVAFQSVEDQYDIYCVANRLRDNLFSVSLYGYEDRLGSFNCGEYMMKHYNGGGHKGAAGGKLNLEQFNRLIRDKKI